MFTAEQGEMIVKAGRAEPKQEAYGGEKKGMRGGV